MENIKGYWDIINELVHGRELVKQLHDHIDGVVGEMLLAVILSSLDKVLISMKNQSSSISVMSPKSGSGGGGGCPQTADSGRGGTYRKRKAAEQWSKEVRACPETGMEGPVEDGYCWRKYGQKDILGANYPRGYYRCTYRSSQGCVAIKQVQRSNNNSSIFTVTYRGMHTCNFRPSQHRTSVSQEQLDDELPSPEISKGIFINFGSSGDGSSTDKTETKDQDSNQHPPATSMISSFSFSSVPVEGTGTICGHEIFSSESSANSSPTLASLPTNELNYNQCQMKKKSDDRKSVNQVVAADVSGSLDCPDIEMNFILNLVDRLELDLFDNNGDF